MLFRKKETGKGVGDFRVQRYRDNLITNEGLFEI